MADNPFDTSDPTLLDVASRAEGPSGSLPFTAEMLLTRPFYFQYENARQVERPDRARKPCAPKPAEGKNRDMLKILS